MTWHQFVISFLYACGTITVGLLLHPYQTMQSLVQERAFLWLTLLPLAVLVLVKVVWFFVLVPLVRFVFSCSSSGFFGCDLIPFVANWLVLFCVYWQILLFYLAVRFTITFRE
ncbi:MAG: hypothetical protein A2632_01945 [Candidatus Pacebacteria bacterium RIFCSPHIGHO2_01_FULL_46_16]|nr:MAG: hypothetical protein A2632_01945 [Candidatus Pacebacteria bacterium RIFCSPHIGHO2_01_FULL_46_16]OGJ20677.1 MAG: hypothetical protein A3J60_00640 [Candidatus Pacebacteria bacterium RIFCSPHIGHO2_02_FULL_46_9]